MERDDLIVLKIFWPNRSQAKGFSIEKLAKSFRKKNLSSSSDKTSSHSLYYRKLKSIKENINNVETPKLTSNRVHWANRDFSEYWDAA